MDVWGAPLPAGCLYSPLEFVRKNPKTIQAMTNAIVRANRWIAKASATDLVKVVPPAYLLGDQALYMFSYNKVKEAVSPDGMISDVGARATLKALAAFVPGVSEKTINLEETYTNAFVKKATAKFK